MSPHGLPRPQEPEERKGEPDSVTRGEYLDKKKWFHINKKYRFHKPQISLLGSPMPVSKKKEVGPEAAMGIQSNQSRRTIFPSWKENLRQGKKNPGTKSQKRSQGKLPTTLTDWKGKLRDCWKASSHLHQSSQHSWGTQGLHQCLKDEDTTQGQTAPKLLAQVRTGVRAGLSYPRPSQIKKAEWRDCSKVSIQLSFQQRWECSALLVWRSKQSWQKTLPLNIHAVPESQKSCQCADFVNPGIHQGQHLLLCCFEDMVDQLPDPPNECS